MVPLRCVKIYFESDSVLLRDQTDHATSLGEMFYIADGQQTHTLRNREDRCQMALFRRAYIENVAGSHVLHTRQSLHFYLFRVDALSLNRGVKHFPERVFPKNADCEHVSSGGSIRRPCHELAEVIEVCGFYLRLGRTRVLG